MKYFDSFFFDFSFNFLAPRDGKTDPSGNFKIDIPETDSVFWDAKKFVVRILPSEQQSVSTRILIYFRNLHNNKESQDF